MDSVLGGWNVTLAPTRPGDFQALPFGSQHLSVRHLWSLEISRFSLRAPGSQDFLP